MIKRFLFIEDGSIDTDKLEEELADDTKMIVYRQGGAIPIIYEPKEGINGKSELSKIQAENKELHRLLTKLAEDLNEAEQIAEQYAGLYL